MAALAGGCQTASVDRRGNWTHVVSVPENAERCFRIVDEFVARERAEGRRASLPQDFPIKYAYELWQHPGGCFWVRRDEIIPVRTLSLWYLIGPDGSVRACSGSDMDPEWKDP